jgi:ribonuclease HII
MRILGIDEAGRGAVIGPMVIGGVLVDKRGEKQLIKIGVKDSKELSPKKRELLYPKIKKIAKDYVILKISAKEIDELRKRMNLNRIEAEKMAQIIKTMKADIAYVDTPQVSTEKFKAILLSLARNKTKVICENYADVKYPVCSAASILAKVERDKEIERIKKKVGFDFGVGYTHDPRTIEFLKKLLKRGEYPDFVRRSWITAKDLKSKKEQKTLKEYNK